MDRTSFILVLATLICCAGAAPTGAARVDPVSIYTIQYTTDPSGDSPLAGQVVMTAGTVTAVTADGFTIADSAGVWHAVFVYTVSSGPAVGDSVQVTGSVQEYYGMTEIADVTAVQHLSSGTSVSPLVVSPADAGQEACESVLLRVDSVAVTDLIPYGEWVVDSVLVCDDVNDYFYFPAVGDQLDSVTGVLFYSFEAFKLEPRNTGDIRGTAIPHYALGGDVVTMNDTREVLPGRYVEVDGDRIVAIHAMPPPGVPVIETGGLIFPGLVDAHNHAAYNALGVIPFDSTFQDRYEWQATTLYSDFRDQYNAIRDYGGSGANTPSLHRLAELRALCAGTTTIQGVNCNGHAYDAFAHEGIGINNAERFPARVLSSVFPLSQGTTYWQNRSAEYWDRFVVHLSEGVNATAHDEFATWKTLVPLDERTTIIHGTALDAGDWTELAAAGAHLVWSPRSNVVLYGATADIPGALAAGVDVALAPDWTESGSANLLDEMRFARAIGDSLWGSVLTPQLLAEMVTRNAADAIGAVGRIGEVAAGYSADLMIIPGSPGAPYEALLAARPEDVMITVVSGRPMVGEPSLMSQFGFLEGTEAIVVGSALKTLAMRVVSHAIPETGVAVAGDIDDLETAWAATAPRVCCFLGIDRLVCEPTGVDDGPPGAGVGSLHIHPNPFNPATTIEYRLPRAQTVQVAVYDVAGRRVVTLASGPHAAGPHSIAWDGRDGRGRPVASGVYLVRVHGSRDGLVAKAVVLK